MELIFFDKMILSLVFENDIDFVLTDRAAYITVMKICKLMLTTVSHAKFQVVVEACSADPQSPNITQAEHSHALILQQALQFIPTLGQRSWHELWDWGSDNSYWTRYFNENHSYLKHTNINMALSLNV